MTDPAPATAPQVVVTCVNPRCARYQQESTVPAGVGLTADVIGMFSKLSCAECGYDLQVVSGT